MPLPRFPLFFTALAALTSAVTAFADPIPATSTITAATVYAERAIVTRTARIELPAGPSELVFSNLPAGIFDNSIQVAGRGTAATILDVVARTTYTTVTADPRVKTLEDELTALKRQDRTLEDKLAVVYQQQGLLTKIETAVTQPAPATKDSAAARPTFDDWQKLLAFSADNATRTASDRQTLEQQREELARKIEAAKSSLAQLGDQTPVHRAAKTVTVRVAAPQAGSLDLTLDYAVPGAAWGPDYTARLHSEKREIELTYFGQVINATGEDWKAVALTLSTARPNLGAGAPELSPWIVDAPDARAYSDSNGFSLLSKKPKRPSPDATVIGAMGSMAFNGIALDSASASGLPAAPADSTISLATLDTSVSSASFKIPAAATLLSDNAPQKVGIATATLPANLQYQAAPKLREIAFLAAYTSNPTDFPFLAGPVSTFLDNTFVTTGSLKTVMPGEKFSLDLGADSGVAITRKLVNRFTEETGFTAKNRRTTYEFLITVTNHKRTAERVVVKDVLPTTRDEKIAVKLLAPAEKETGTKEKPGREVTREEEGKLVWRLDLKPGEKRELPFKFTIEHPSDLPVTGLD